MEKNKANNRHWRWVVMAVSLNGLRSFLLISTAYNWIWFAPSLFFIYRVKWIVFFIELSQTFIVFLSTIGLYSAFYYVSTIQLITRVLMQNAFFSILYCWIDYDVVFSWFARNEWLALTDLLCVILLFVYCCCECYIIYNVLVLLLLLNGVDYFFGSCDKRNCVIFFFFIYV